ncbi:MAG: GIY-YIG nuclease family protein [Parabacteroides sp.]|nr:GIY-YIG nuclease family protein [Parabacteroides sp.]
MAQKNFFPLRSESNPMIYAYEDTNPQYKGLLKIGYTCKDVQARVAQQYPTLRPGSLPYRIVFEGNAMRNDGSSFTDRDIHRYLRKQGFYNPKGEWFQCSKRDVKAAVLALKERIINEEQRTETFSMRPEQKQAVEKTAHYFTNYQKENEGKTPHFLWNCKMRFGKTFAAYQLAKRMNWRRILVLTFKPAVQHAWEEDLVSHIDFKGWQFISRSTELSFETADKKRPIVCFGSFQDYLGKNKVGGIKTRNEWVHLTNWDCVILDEYHYGAWRENAKDLFEKENKQEIEYAQGKGIDYFDEEIMPITTNAYLYLSGTPFRAIHSGEFIEEQIYNWTYSDEQRAKMNWEGENNPYETLPRMVMLTYQMPNEIRSVAMDGEFNEFDLNIFFSAEGEGEFAEFIYKDEVQKWLNLIRGAYTENIISDLKLRTEKPPMPFSHAPLLKALTHTFWFLPSVASCYAMKNLLEERQNRFYQDYKIIIAAGTEAGIGIEALYPVQKAMGNPLETKTITLSCGKLTTGVSVKPWSGIFMLRNSSSPETYFQAAFRVQTPWVIKNPDSISPNKTEILKEECYVFDFAPDRALRQIADYSCRLNVEESNPEKKVEEFINFLPVLAYDGSHMKQIDATGILDIAMSGTSATLLARRWESALLVNVDNETLRRLMNNAEAMNALMNIEGFRNLNQDIETIINKSESVKKAKKQANNEELSSKEKKELTQEEKEYKSLRKKIQEKLIKFATRVPVFMYLTDYRERCLKDVITLLEPALFKKVTGLSVQDFELLVSLNVFNSALMNDAIFKFKRYEDASLEYVGINKHTENAVGLFDTVLTRTEYEQIFINEDI